MKKSKKIAFSAILCALTVIILMVGSIISVLDLTTAAITSILVVFAVIEIGGSYPVWIYLASSILSLLLLPQKFPALLYFLFAGIYPIFKALFERFHYLVAWVLKFSLFNIGLLLVIVLSTYVFHLPDTGMGFELVTIGVANLTFLLYDIALTKLITLYLVKIRSRFKLKNYFEN